MVSSILIEYAHDANHIIYFEENFVVVKNESDESYTLINKCHYNMIKNLIVKHDYITSPAHLPALSTKQLLSFYPDVDPQSGFKFKSDVPYLLHCGSVPLPWLSFYSIVEHVHCLYMQDAYFELVKHRMKTYLEYEFNVTLTNPDLFRAELTWNVACVEIPTMEIILEKFKEIHVISYERLHSRYLAFKRELAAKNQIPTLYDFCRHMFHIEFWQVSEHLIREFAPNLIRYYAFDMYLTNFQQPRVITYVEV